MKKTGFIIGLFFVIFLITNKLSAQVHIQKKKSLKTITFNPARLILNEVRFGYERQLAERHTIRLSLGYQYPTSKDTYCDLKTFFYTTPFYYAVSEGMYLGLAYNYVLGLGSRIYVSPELYFSTNHYDKKYREFIPGSQPEVYVNLESMKLRNTGLKVLFGRKIRIFRGNKVGFEFDYLIGFGAQYRYKKTTTFAWGRDFWLHSALIKMDPPETKIVRTWHATLSLGLLICLHFGEQ